MAEMKAVEIADGDDGPAQRGRRRLVASDDEGTRRGALLVRGHAMEVGGRDARTLSKTVTRVKRGRLTALKPGLDKVALGIFRTGGPEP